MTTDAVGGVWRYSLDLARELAAGGDCLMLAGLGPHPSVEQVREVQSFATLAWLETPPDWMTFDEGALDRFPDELQALATAFAADLVHLNAPAQAARIDLPCPVVVVSHSCVVTWLQAVRGQAVAAEWAWQEDRNRAGFDRVGAVVSPSRSHAAMLETCYGPIARLSIVHNSAQPGPVGSHRDAFALAAARWWDEGKNAKVLDAAAAIAEWPVYAAGPLDRADGQRACLDHCVTLGPVGHAEVRRLMARAGIFVSPSIYEPFGLAALEAALSGAPLVLADIATYREIWDGAAMFFDMHDPHALAQRISQLARDADLRHQFGRRAARRARQFSPQAQATAMREIYARAAMAVVGH
ncbi:glycosyltransferase family 4 protein [Mesorhizobium sp. WSM4884]|uniref:glycosyltransferase family 4 protein n=1 Tax=Mesorhizobium sp. WSM4884 TaxID=3038542 RepID=UPI0024170D41|nr:glycosyltransferase family 4 protein [Mesorhizobium sp. WSM4884]MDG4882728.1 glycosyltransferase family 4 protein [Mesorhizobium sp. WSM4884]